jgi:oxysterol-binding protein 1
MRARDLHPLCCLAGEWQPCAGHAASRQEEEELEEALAPAVAGVLYKWTNIGRGWRPRLFAIRGGVLAYSKIRRRVVAEPTQEAPAAVRLIGTARGTGERPIGFVHLKVTPSSSLVILSRLLLISDSVIHFSFPISSY